MLVEMILPDAVSASFSKLLDLNMLVMNGGRKRTIAEVCCSAQCCRLRVRENCSNHGSADRDRSHRRLNSRQTRTRLLVQRSLATRNNPAQVGRRRCTPAGNKSLSVKFTKFKTGEAKTFCDFNPAQSKHAKLQTARPVFERAERQIRRDKNYISLQNFSQGTTFACVRSNRNSIESSRAGSRSRVAEWHDFLEVSTTD